MKIFIFIILLLLPVKSHADEAFVDVLKENGKLIFIRHAYAPGNGDPGDFILSDCSTQRNLNDEGIQESKDIGIFFKKIM